MPHISVIMVTVLNLTVVEEVKDTYINGIISVIFSWSVQFDAS